MKSKSQNPTFSSSITPGQSNDFEIIGYEGEASVVERLKELGFFPGLKITFLGRAPFAGPVLFRFGAMVLALREEEAACLTLKSL